MIVEIFYNNKKLEANEGERISKIEKIETGNIIHIENEGKTIKSYRILNTKLYNMGSRLVNKVYVEKINK